MHHLDDRLLPVLLDQHFLVTNDDVLRAGGTLDQIERRLRDGRWVGVDRRVYRPSGIPMTWFASLLAPILGARGHAKVAATDRSAAALHGIPGFGRGRPELATPRGFNLRRSGVHVRTSTDLDRCRLVEIEGIPTTSLPRTLLDLARTISDARLLRCIEWARRERGLTWSDLISTLAHHARKGRGGVRRLRRVLLANAHRDEVTDSDLEMLLLALLREHGLAEPTLHHRVHDGERFVAEVDLAYVDLRIAIEVDGLVHLQEDVWRKDLPRQNDLVLQGWQVLRFSWERITKDPGGVISEVRAAIRRARAARSAA